MARYPEILLSRQTYPILKNDDVRDNALVRETTVDVYQFLTKQGYEPDDILPLVIAPQPSLREVFDLSTFLYGYFEERHIGIRVNDAALYADWNNELPELMADEIQFYQETAFPLYLAAAKLDRQEIDFNGETHILSFSHKPTRVNYWHFELWVKDSAGNRIPRDKSNAHTKYLAKSILEYIISEAVLLKTQVNIFKRSIGTHQ
ncbi:hypothetical protein R84B8_01359 [Treponema sp. R8-4-B8]